MSWLYAGVGAALLLWGTYAVIFAVLGWSLRRWKGVIEDTKS
jgi:hypothetical protein